MTIASRFLTPFLLLSINCFGGELSWPKQMFTSKALNENFYRPFVEYFDKAMRAHPYQWKDNGTLAFYHGNREFFTVRVAPLSNGTCDKHMVLFNAYHRHKTRFVLESCEADRKAPTVNEILNGEFFKTENFRVTFLDWGFSVTNKKNNNGVQTVYNSAGGETKVILFESQSSNSLYSELYYMCDSCNSEPLIATGKKADGKERFSYYMGIDGAAVDPLAFFNVANRFYLGWIFRRMDSFLKDSQNSKGWPEI